MICSDKCSLQLTIFRLPRRLLTDGEPIFTSLICNKKWWKEYRNLLRTKITCYFLLLWIILLHVAVFVLELIRCLCTDASQNSLPEFILAAVNASH